MCTGAFLKEERTITKKERKKRATNGSRERTDLTRRGVFENSLDTGKHLETGSVPNACLSGMGIKGLSIQWKLRLARGTQAPGHDNTEFYVPPPRTADATRGESTRASQSPQIFVEHSTWCLRSHRAKGTNKAFSAAVLPEPNPMDSPLS